MRQEKKFISAEYLARLNRSPFFIVTDYTGLKVQHFSELRKRLRQSGAEVHVVKNTIFKIAAREAGIAELGGTLSGQIAVVTGPKDISAAAKVLKTFAAEFEKPKVRFGCLNAQHIDAAGIAVLADLPSIEVLRGKLLGLFQAPAGQLVRLLNEPAASLARVLQAKADKPA
ncbi:MAG: 50S ribosomal protein L10 [Verrucomicrobiales bacterium]|nr:50S ribosomal protein L10 [Verrucomicrobiales bacterium]